MIKALGFMDCSSKETSVALGCFDGLHLGHKEVIMQAVKMSYSSLCPTVFTFSNTPKVKLKGKNPSNLLTFEDKIEIQNYIKNGLEDELQRKYKVTYWNDETNTYETGYFYIPDTQFSIYTIKNNSILYNSFKLTLIEY